MTLYRDPGSYEVEGYTFVPGAGTPRHGRVWQCDECAVWIADEPADDLPNLNKHAEWHRHLVAWESKEDTE